MFCYAQGMTPRILDLYSLLQEANFDPWESVSSVLHLQGPKAERLKAHILETKRMYWSLIEGVVQLTPPPAGLEDLMQYELEMVQNLKETDLDHLVHYCDRNMTVAALIRLSARHSVWHAGQMALKKLD